jgi:hypothetical protein
MNINLAPLRNSTVFQKLECQKGGIFGPNNSQISGLHIFKLTNEHVTIIIVTFKFIFMQLFISKGAALK